jgi:uncharacterized protein YhbP (UPF0306 family)
MNETIIHFLQQQTCATICCIDEHGKPYCFNCFYAFNIESGMLYFKSSAASYHAALMKKNPFIAGTILPDKLNILSVMGIQFEGYALNEHHALLGQASVHFHRRHPLALAMPGEIWALRIDHIKMTDSTKGFGKKIAWNRTEEKIVQEYQ